MVEANKDEAAPEGQQLQADQPQQSLDVSQAEELKGPGASQVEGPGPKGTGDVDGAGEGHAQAVSESESDGEGAEGAGLMEIEVRFCGPKLSKIPTTLLRVSPFVQVGELKAELEAKLKEPLGEGVMASHEVKLLHSGQALAFDKSLDQVGGGVAGNEVLTLHAMLVVAGANKTPIKEYVARARSIPNSPNKNASSSASGTPKATSLPASPGSARPQAPPVTPQNHEWLDDIKKKVEFNMRKAFWDALEAAINSDKPDFEWVVRLYAETRDRLCALTPRRGDMHSQIHSALDVQLFDQMIRNNAFEPEDLRKLVTFTFDKLQALCSPARDDDLMSKRRELEVLVATEGTTFAVFAVKYLKYFHQIVDEIESDIAEFKKQAQMQGRSPAASGRPASATHSPSPAPASSSAAADAGPGQAPEAASPGSVRALKNKLRQLGVSDDVLSNCVEKRELESLLDKAISRASGTVSGGAVPGMQTSNQASRGAVPSVNRNLFFTGESEAEQQSRDQEAVFKILKTSTGSAITTRQLPMRSNDTMQDIKSKLCTALADGPPLDPQQIKLVYAGQVLADNLRLAQLSSEGTEMPCVHVVIKDTASPAKQ